MCKGAVIAGMVAASNCETGLGDISQIASGLYRFEIVLAVLWGVAVFWISVDLPCPWPFSKKQSYNVARSRMQWVGYLFPLAQYAYTDLQAASAAATRAGQGEGGEVWNFFHFTGGRGATNGMPVWWRPAGGGEGGGGGGEETGWMPLDKTVVCQVCAYGYLLSLCADMYIWNLLDLAFVKVAVQAAVSFATFWALFGGYDVDCPTGRIGLPLMWCAALLHSGIVMQRLRMLWRQRVVGMNREGGKNLSNRAAVNLTAWATTDRATHTRVEGVVGERGERERRG